MMFLNIFDTLTAGDVAQLLLAIGGFVGVYITLQNRVTKIESKQESIEAQITNLKMLETIINSLNVAVAKLQVTVENLKDLVDTNIEKQNDK